MTDPITATTTGISLFKSATDLGKKVYELWQESKDHALKQKLGDMLDRVTELKHQASKLEDENRELREAQRFKSDEFEFRNPFHYEKSKPGIPLCAKCFADKRIAPVGNPWQGAGGMFAKCLACQTTFEINNRGTEVSYPDFEWNDSGGENGWMR